MRLFKAARANILRGLLALLPLGLCWLVLRFLYRAVDQKVARYIERWLGVRVPGLGLLLVLVILLVLGWLAGHWAGRRLFALLDRISGRIPLVKTIYSLGRQLGRAFSLPGSPAVQRVVLLEHFRPGVWSVGFVMGTVREAATRARWLKVFIPTAPNPTAGFMVMVREDQVRDAGWTVAEAMNTVLSGGIIGPEEIR